ncbi:acyl-CoA/acyl-ACP dehydrogenase [Kitasatospora purpeofusca]|nr:acyl-CoA/acyl-ACP dehydrogenase [Kitasatospora purpeofusca]
MRFMRRERETMERFLPGLDAALENCDWQSLENPGSPGIKHFRTHGGPALVVPLEHSGKGADALQAVRVQRALGSRSPSLAVATTMHHFSVASLLEAYQLSQGMEWMLLESIAHDRLLVASGFAEGIPGRGILSPTMSAEPATDGILISGTKKPCSLSHSMDLLTVSVSVPLKSGKGQQMAVAVVPAQSPGVRVEAFWGTPALAGAESHAVVLESVAVPEDLLVRIDPETEGRMDALQTAGFIWFELLMTASYLGAASALAEQVLREANASSEAQAAVLCELESAMGAVEGVALRTAGDLAGDDALVATLICRYTAQGAIGRTVRRCVEMLGGMAFVRNPRIAYLLSCTDALAFHPPSRLRMATSLHHWYAGAPLLMT